MKDVRSKGGGVYDLDIRDGEGGVSKKSVFC